jgi:signal transduction histidine kinase
VGFDLATVVREYAVLRNCILDAVEDAGVALTIDELRSLADSINAGIADAVVEYSESRTRIIELFLGVLTHDLRDPLNAVSTGAQLIMRHQSELPAVVIRVCGRISVSAERMASLLNELMDFSRAGLGGGLRLRRRFIDLYDVTSSVVDELEISYPDRTFQVEVEGSCTGFWDADRMAQVISNVGTNAVRYGTKESPVSFRIRAVGEEGIIEVHNFGSVIPKATATTLFDPFVTDPKNGGTGLGLYIVREIVRAHDGTIEVESSEAAGTTFRIRLPRGVT